MKIWVDIKNSHEPLFFRSLAAGLSGHEFLFTARDYIEVTKLLDRYGYHYTTVGRHHGRKLIMKLYGLIHRELGLFFRTGKFDVSLSHGSVHAVHVAAAKRKKSIQIYDNDLPTLNNRLALPFLDYLIIPESIDRQKFQRFSKRLKIFTFDGFKEDIYVADHRPDPAFMDGLPFTDFVAVRPEALNAEYVPADVRSIVPQLLRELDRAGIGILYLPRYPQDREWGKEARNIFIPPEPLNGLDVCHYARAVLTGSGTFAREAAAMGTPAVSFYPGEELLSVDREMIRRGWMIHSREPSEIVDFVRSARRKPLDRERTRGNETQDKRPQEPKKEEEEPKAERSEAERSEAERHKGEKAEGEGKKADEIRQERIEKERTEEEKTKVESTEEKRAQEEKTRDERMSRERARSAQRAVIGIIDDILSTIKTPSRSS